MRWFLVPVLVLHGAIHLLGFPLAWGGAIAGMTGETLVPFGDLALRCAGIAWFVACLAFLGASLGVALGREWWRPVALGAVVVSQALIAIWWRDARAGTLANVLILAILVWRPGLAMWRDALKANARA